MTIYSKPPLSILKGKLAHTSMISRLILIPCLLDMAKTLVTENSADIDIICI